MKSINIVTPALITMSVGGGISMAGSLDPTELVPDRRPVRDVAHIYYNFVSGERVVTLAHDGQTAPADAGESVSLWSTLGDIPACAADAGYTTAFFFGFDDPGTTALSTAAELVQWGDIAKDTVVDCISVSWVTGHADTDTNSDSVGDGVEELAGQWRVWDADNGRNVDVSTRLPLVDIILLNLPGNIAGPGVFSGYTLNIDIADGFDGNDLTFEIGDSDGDCQGASYCNSNVDYDSDGIGDGPVAGPDADRNFDGLPDSDLDGDGLFDWAWSVRFYQPGTGNDFDSDGDSGVVAGSDSDTIGVSFGYPVGFEPSGGSDWSIDAGVSDAATGIEDGFAFYADGTHQGNFWFGGFQCPDAQNEYNAFTSFSFQLWGPGEQVCRADFNDDGQLNFFDVSSFIQSYNDGGDYNDDGSTNFFDVSLFIQEFNAGCP
ncbi:MAG: hypothetical protein ACX94C_05685 [Phycisphaerales bacterium]